MEKQFGIFKYENKEEIKKLIFLDIDGVLVTKRILQNKNRLQFLDDNNYNFDKDSKNVLEDIVSATEAKIIITASWKCGNLEKIKNIFLRRNFKYAESIIGETGTAYNYLNNVGREILSVNRGNEIETWLKFYFGYNYNEKIKYAIIDDDDDMLYKQKNNFVHTTFEVGLTPELGKKTIYILNGFFADE